VPQNILAAPETTQEPACCAEKTNPRTGKASIKSWAGFDRKIAEILAETDWRFVPNRIPKLDRDLEGERHRWIQQAKKDRGFITELKRRWQHEAEQPSESETKTDRPS